MGKPSFAAPGGWGFGEPCSEPAWEALRATAHRWQVGWSGCRVSGGGRDVLYPAPLCLHFAAGKTESERRGIDSKDTGYFSEHLFPVPPPAWHRAGATGQWEDPCQAQAKPLSAPGRLLPTPPRAPLPAVLGTAQGLRNSPLQRVGLPAATPAPSPVPQPPQARHWPPPSTFSRPVHLQASAAQRALISVSNI